ncbi:MAG: DUF5615 family PIN-like protein [Deltaproteobacteria bacterium]|nr:DUF5615 family PIN-like protein [Deltaproteobacteria bacterium]
MKFLIDEDMPRSLAPALRASGFDAVDARDAGLRGHADAEVFSRAVAEGRVLITEDLGFSNLLAFPLGQHAGIVVARFPSQVPTWTLNQAVVEALRSVTEAEVVGGLVIVEPGRVRLRRLPSPTP